MIPGTESSGLTNPDNPRSINRLSELAGLLADVSVLIAGLEVNQTSDQTQHSFSFEFLDTEQVMIPPAVSEVMAEVDQITVTISKEAIDSPSVLSIDLFSDAQTVTISRSGNGTESHQPDVLIDTSFKLRPGASLFHTAKQQMNSESHDSFEDRITPIKTVPTAELNSLIMSLIYPDNERGYEMFSHVNFLDPSTYESLKESFRLSTLSTNNATTYDFQSSESRFHYTKEQDQPISFTFRYIESNKEGRLVTLQSNMDTDFRLEFTTDYELVRSNGLTTDEKMPYYPSTTELAFLRSVLKTEIAALDPIPVECLENLQIDTNDAATVFTAGGGDVLSRDYVRKVLDQLGLDAPDTGTA